MYKARWEIELFFKALKRTLRVKTFVGTSENAVADADLDGADRDVADQIPATAVDIRLVIVKPGCTAAATTICIPRSLALD